MKQLIFSILSCAGTLLCGMLASCSDELAENPSATVTVVDDTHLVEAKITLNVAAMAAHAATPTTRANGDNANPESTPMTDEEKRGTDAERRIDNIWVFQFDATSGRLLITPRYYDISDLEASPDETNGKEVDVLLKPDVESVVYVVANTGVSTWATADNSPTLDSVMHRNLPLPNFIPVNVDGDLAVEGRRIPMEGASARVTPQDHETINVKVTRMFAKVEISIGYIPETLDITDVQVGNIPNYCRVGSLDLDDENDYQRADYPKDTEWVEYAFKPGEKGSDGKYTGKMVIYVPENLQGRNTQATPDDLTHKTENAYADALYLNFIADYKNLFTGTIEDVGRSYMFYPGANDYSDYNIKRNNIYRVSLAIYTDKYEQDTPSSNCFVVKPGQLLSFLPYYRTEEGGGHEFTDYLDAESEDPGKQINDSGEMLENIKIIWQTKDAIGDNTKGDLVWIDRRSEAKDEFHRKIHVRAGKRGNALIAAYDKNGLIVWSWHIWVTENEPANLSSAVVYSTYAWNENGIVTNIRVPGYAIMPCNLGALEYEPEGGEYANDVAGTYQNKVYPNTHGMLYQWGRKDPFPPSTRNGHSDSVPYDDNATGRHYDNDNQTVVGKTSAEDEDKLFHSVLMDNVKNNAEIAYSVKHPTVFICGTAEADQNEKYVKDYSTTNYVARGDWQYKHDETLWGGLDPDMKGSMKYLALDMAKDPAGNVVHIFDNYGDQKSIYDPCPSGWRVPPGELWLGFTQTGMNPTSDGMYGIINTSTPQGKSKAGMYMYMNGWKTGEKIFFPTQGTRVADGRIIRSASCGNYHNATTDATNGGQRVNILHIHNSGGLFRVFETTFYMYFVKATAGPIRCVRDHK